MLPEHSRIGNLAKLIMWKTYAERNGRQPDFKVKYRFFSAAEGGRVHDPYQGYRSDLHYDGEDIANDGVYMIWPEFLRSDGTVILEEGAVVPREGEAFMWIVWYETMRDYHKTRALPGRHCWLMEGPRKVAEAVVIEQIGLKD